MRNIQIILDDPIAVVSDDGVWFYPDNNKVYGIIGTNYGPTDRSTIGWTLDAAINAGFKLIYSSENLVSRIDIR